MKPNRVHNFGTYFITTQTFGHRALFQNTTLAKLLIETLFHYRSENKFLLHDFVIMPDHLHAIITPAEITLERVMQLIKGGFSHAATEHGFGNLEIWQRGFSDHRIRDEQDYLIHQKYLWNNPVRRRLCEHPEQYEFSSANGDYVMDDLPQRLKPLELAAPERHG